LSFGGLVFALQGFSVLGVELRANPETPGINPDAPENSDIPDVKSEYSGFLQYYRRRVISN
jgi:hypothetical protein